jgi:vesicle coat complex subunit
VLNKLYEMLRDRDPQVVANCIAALNEILAREVPPRPSISLSALLSSPFRYLL